MRMKGSIIKKLFIITSIFFIAFISCILVFQSLFFQRFYVNKKMNNLQSNIKQFEGRYNKIQDYEKIVMLIKDFEYKNNSKIVILNNSGQLNFLTDLNNEESTSTKIKVIKKIIYGWMSDPEAFINMKESKKILTYISENKEYNVKNIVCVLPNQKTSEVIFAVSSLQPVNEAGVVIKEFYIYFYIGAIIIIIILSFIYSNMISKPLLKVNKTASKMAQMDFSQKCFVEGDDEIGNLANTLNFLSEKLNYALISLTTANAKLKNDINKERQLEKMRKEFVAGVSHELKTPISLIEGYAEGLKDNIVEGDQKDYYIDVIIDEARKMGTLVHDMLDLAQLESGNFKLKKEVFFLDKFLNSTAKKYYNIINKKNIDFQINLIRDKKVLGDKYRIEQVVTNFLTNAISHVSEEGKIILNMLEEKNKIFVEIKNTGKFIPEKELTKIWDKFYKEDKSRNRKFGETGLGLSIAKNILLLHESDFGVKNLDKGVKFYFSLEKVV